MKKILFLSTFLLNSFLGFSQEKHETQQWIKDKLEYYAYSDDLSVKYKFEISYQETNLILIKTNFLDLDSRGNFQSFKTTYIIPIQDLSKIRFESKEDNIWLYIKTRDGIKSIKEKVDFENSSTLISETSLILEKDFNSDNLIERTIKAFNHLIKLSGGYVSKETF